MAVIVDGYGFDVIVANFELVLVPRVVAAVATTTAISAASSAYSIMAAPRRLGRVSRFERSACRTLNFEMIVSTTVSFLRFVRRHASGGSSNELKLF